MVNYTVVLVRCRRLQKQVTESNLVFYLRNGIFQLMVNCESTHMLESEAEKSLSREDGKQSPAVSINSCYM